MSKLFLKSERGSVVSSVLSLLGLLIVVAGVIFTVFFFVLGVDVPPNYIGVRQNYRGIPGILADGYEPEGLAPGRHWTLPHFSTVILIPRSFLFVDLNSEDSHGNLTLASLEVPTIDGSKVKTDISFVVRYFDSRGEIAHAATVIPENNPNVNDDNKSKSEPVTHRRASTTHGGPSDLILTYQADLTNQLRTFAATASNELKIALSSLSTTDFYNPQLRELAALKANTETNEAVNPKGINLWGTLIRRYIYSEKNIDDQIFAKNLQDQTERLNAAASRLEGARAETEKQRAVYDAKIRDLEVDGESRVKVVRSEGDLYEAKKTAEGDLLVHSATAEIEAARANALQNASGADVYVAKQMSPLLETLQGGVVSGIDPYDIDAWMDRLTPRSGSERGSVDRVIAERN